MSKILHSLAATRKRATEIETQDESSTSERSKKKIKLLTKPETPIPATSSKKSKKSSIKTPETASSVVYLGHIAHGFYETEIKKFFSQFGKVQKLKLVRSKKTGGSRGHAFIKFASSEIAEVVAAAIDGYFLNERQLVCHVVPPNKIHDGLFARSKGVSKIVRKSNEDKSIKTNESNGNDDNDGNDNEEDDSTQPETTKEVDDQPLSDKKLLKLTRLQARKQKRLRELGINISFLNTQIE